jgi:hypothetical protein
MRITVGVMRRAGTPGLRIATTRPVLLILAGCLAAAPLTPVISAQARGVLGPVPLGVPLVVHPGASASGASRLVTIATADSSRGTQWLGAGMAFGLAFASIGFFTGAMACEGGFANQQCIHSSALGGLFGGAIGFAVGAFVGSFIPKPETAAEPPDCRCR